MEPDTDWNALSPAEKARSLAEKGRQARVEGQDQVAYGFYGQSLHLYRGLEDRPNILRILIRLSYLTGWADFGDGLDMFARRNRLGEEALPLAREIGDSALLAQALCTFSATLPHEQAQAMLEESIALSAANGDKATLALALYRLAGATGMQGDRTEAKRLHTQALELYQEIGDKSGTASTLVSLSIHADKDQKRSYLEQALEMRRELGAKRGITEILMMLDMYCDPADLDRREAYNQEALILCREFGSPIWEAGRLKNLAQIAKLRGDEARAEELDRESRSVYDEPEPDPALLEAFGKALESGDMQKIAGTLKRLSPS